MIITRKEVIPKKGHLPASGTRASACYGMSVAEPLLEREGGNTMVHPNPWIVGLALVLGTPVWAEGNPPGRPLLMPETAVELPDSPLRKREDVHATKDRSDHDDSSTYSASASTAAAPTVTSNPATPTARPDEREQSAGKFDRNPS